MPIILHLGWIDKSKCAKLCEHTSNQCREFKIPKMFEKRASQLMRRNVEENGEMAALTWTTLLLPRDNIWLFDNAQAKWHLTRVTYNIFMDEKLGLKLLKFESETTPNKYSTN